MIFACVVALAAIEAAPDEASNPDRPTYEAAAASAGRDGDSQVRLALWCEARGMAAERLKHLTRAVLLDPDNEKARGLLGQVRRDGKWMRADDVAKAVEDSPEQKAMLDEYQKRRVKAADNKADDQYKLALWCEEHGLTQPMLAHLHRTLQLDPDREGALRRLGFQKVGSRWVNPEAEAALKAEREAQARADKEWKPKLEKIRAALAGRDRSKRAEADAELAAITDPRAVPSIWRAFGRGDEARQRLALGTLAQIEGPAASTALATLAVFSPHATIRFDAGALLRLRDPRDFARFLAGLVRTEVRYKVKPVEGPGGQGGLLVEGKDAKVLRRYTPLQRPQPPPGSFMTLGADGLLVAKLPIGVRFGRFSPSTADSATSPEASRDALIGRVAASPGMGTTAKALKNALSAPSGSKMIFPRVGTDPRAPQRYEEVPIFEEFLEIPIGQMENEAQYSALVARGQLIRDVQAIEASIAPVREMNERTLAVLKNISGRDFGDDPEKWAAWAIDLEGYSFSSDSPRSEPVTYVEDVPIAFTPQAAPTLAFQSMGTAVVPRHSCFAAGTMVRTLRGPRPIETIQAGDQVLAQDTTTGEFRYQAVETAYHNPPNETYRIALGGDEVVATGIHRFWKAGRGWVMARDLKPGDHLRTVGGSAVVKAVEKDRVQPVFNLRLVGGDAFCVGSLGVVAHDNSFVAPVAVPFDAVVELAAVAKP